MEGNRCRRRRLRGKQPNPFQNTDDCVARVGDAACSSADSTRSVDSALGCFFQRSNLIKLAEQFEEASKAAIVQTDIITRANLLLHSAWGGSDGGQASESLPEAVRVTSDLLQELCESYLRIAPAKLAVKHPGFLKRKYETDVRHAFKRLRVFAIGKFRSADFNNVVDALYGTRQRWGKHKLSSHVRQVLAFFKDLHALSDELWRKTRCRIANDMPKQMDALPMLVCRKWSRIAPLLESYLTHSQVAACYTCVPKSVLEEVQELPWDRRWAQLFPRLGCSDADNMDSDEDPDGFDSDGHWLTPRMALKLHESAVRLFVEWRVNPGVTTVLHCNQLPTILKPFLRSESWRAEFAECFLRLASRIAKGILPSPNCTGEEMALNLVISHAKSSHFTPEGYAELPSYGPDSDYERVEDLAVEDQDVLMLLDEQTGGACIPPSWDLEEPAEEDEFNWSQIVQSMMHGQIQETMGLANLHPAEWFIAFDSSRMFDHV